MKQLTKNNINKLLKGSVAIAMAGAFTFSPSFAFAEETISDNNLPVVEMPNTNADNTSDNTQNESVQLNEDSHTNPSTSESPSLLPGHFFYFAKIAFEKIKLAFTLDKVDDAKLLATYAAERLAEAESLFSSGDEQKAIETLQKATEYMKSAESIVNDRQEKSDTEGTESTKDETTTNENETGSVVPVPTEEEKAVEENKDQEINKEEKSVNDVKVLISQNIVALTAAMNKVKNPTAKAALQKNIEKAYKKLLKKQAKLAKKEINEDSQENKVEEKVPGNDGSTTTSPSTVTTEPTETSQQTVSIEDETKKQDALQEKEISTSSKKATKKAVKKAAKEVKKSNKKEIKQKVKQQKKNYIKQVKKEKTSKKMMEKQKRNKSQQQSHNHAVKGNGKHNGQKKH